MVSSTVKNTELDPTTFDDVTPEVSNVTPKDNDGTREDSDVTPPPNVPTKYKTTDDTPSSLLVDGCSPNMETQATPAHVTVTVHAEQCDDVDDRGSNYDNAETESLLETSDVTINDDVTTNDNVTEVTYEVPEATVIDVSGSSRQDSWERLKLASNEKKIKSSEAVAALGNRNQHSRHSESPLGYKSWLLRLSRRRRLEVLIGVGLSLWLAFFVVLAIFMNGKSSKTSSDNFNYSGTKLTPPQKGNHGLNFTHTNTHPLPSATTTVTFTPTPTLKNFPSKDDSPPQVNPTVSANPSNEFKPTNRRPDKTTAVSTEGNAKKSQTTESYNAIPTTPKTLPTTPTTPETLPTTPTTPETLPTTPTASKALPTTPTTPKALPTIPTNPTTSSANVHESTTMALDKMKQMFSGKDASSSYIIGVGRADITGPAADVNMMGYANPNQVSGGLHMRQYARAFLVQQGRNRILFVNVDACMGSLLVKLEVLKVLKQRYGSLYDAGNVCISGTHTHSAPAGFLQDVLFQITSMGYVPETLKAMVEGIVESIHIAHESAAPGKILMNKGELLDSNINRSPLAYINNPEQERARYKYNVDKDMILLKFIDANGKGIGMINWFAVHCTSMNNTNSLISGDNKGYAELLFEEAMNPGSKPGEGSFVAAFAQSNEGDVSPNTRGPHCIDTGVPCDNVHSTCDGKVHNCIASGPGKDMFESTKIIGKNQFDKAMSLYKNAKSHVTGPVHAVHQYINMTNQTVTLNATHTATTCKPAMGFSFAAGTTDGPGVFDFKQGDTSGNGFWKIVRNFLHGPSKELSACHSPKPILLATGEMQYPYPWQPDVVDTQLFRIGQFLISAVPGEFTTMSGRRLSQAVQEVFTEAEPNVKFESVIAGLSNTYSDYIATYEEYHVQRYEGASTIYGPHTLEAYIQQYKRLSQHMIKDAPLGPSGEAHDIIDKLKSFVLPVIMDTTPFGYSMGDTIVDANNTYYQGDTVSVQFYSGNPRNSPTFNMTFLEVQRLVNQTWEVVLNDGAWDTRFIWERSSFMGNIRGISEATIKWDISPNTPPGKYRVHHYGHYKWALNHKIYPYTGHSKVFNVQPLP